MSFNRNFADPQTFGKKEVRYLSPPVLGSLNDFVLGGESFTNRRDLSVRAFQTLEFVSAYCRLGLWKEDDFERKADGKKTKC
jgi:hypothetical protein